jgi:hypothetical protein
VLPGQLVELLHELEAVRRELLHDLLFTHLVQRLDRHVGILGPKLNQRHPAGGLQALTDRRQHLFRVGKLVIHVDHQHQID